MSLGKKLTGQLKQGSKGSVEVTEGDVKARVDVVGSGPYGAEVRGLSVERVQPRGSDDPDRGGRMDRAVERVQENLTYLPERLAPLESDPQSGRGILRSRREDVRGREYFEVNVQGGDRIDLGRFRGRGEGGGRDVVDENYGHGIIERIVDDLEEIVRDRRERVRDTEE